MIVQDLFKLIYNDREEFAKYYLHWFHPTLKRRNKKQMIMNLVEQLCNQTDLPENKNKAIIFVIPDYPKNDCSENINSFVIHKNDLFIEDNIIDSTKIQPYAYELCTMREILNFNVSDACLYAFGGLYRYLSSILYEMTYFGYSLERQEEEVKETSNNIDEQVENIKNGIAKTISWDELKESLDRNYKIPEIPKKPIYEENFDNEFGVADNIFSNKLFDLLCSLERNYIRYGAPNNIYE